jgi:hypothetical protein
MRRASNVKRNLDRAIRSWAAEDEEVVAMVASVDSARVAYIARMLVVAGVDSQRARARAVFMYWAYLGQAIAMDSRHSTITAMAINDVGDLFEK